VDVTFHLIAVSLLRLARSRIRIAAHRPQCMRRIIEVYSIRTCVFFSTSFHGSFPCIIVCLRRLDMKRVAVLLQQNILAVIRTVTVQLDLV
jgi:hypothetical protein